MVDWFRRTKKGLLGTEKKVIPDGLWIKCPSCSEYLYKRELDRNYWICIQCQYHFRVSSDEYIKMLIDAEYEEFNRKLQSNDPLKFKDSKRYIDRLKTAKAKTGKYNAVVTVEGDLSKHRIVLCVMDFKFIGGSMGSVVGEKISRAIDRAREKKLPLVIVSSSGGARMQEGVLSLMQMAKTSAKLSQFHEEGGLYISILTDPTTGGTTASFAMLGDIIIAEPGALIGFAGPRVIKQTIGKDLPEGFQRSEFLMDKGFLDIICGRSELKRLVTRLLDFFIEND
jgi:acetyl-CoA carboxylase carboxyl transferase subunit beta